VTYKVVVFYKTFPNVACHRPIHYTSRRVRSDVGLGDLTWKEDDTVFTMV